MKTKEIKELTNKELEERVVAGKDELLRLKLNHSISPLDNTAQIKDIRKTVARCLTELRQRELNTK